MIDVLYVRASSPARPGADKVARPFRVAQSLLDDAVFDFLESSSQVTVRSLSVPLEPYYPDAPLISRGRDEEGTALGPPVINLPLVRELSQAIGAFARALKWRRRASGDPQVVLLMTNYLPVAAALRLFGRRHGVPRVVTLTDLAGFSFSEERIATAPLWKRVLMRTYAGQVRGLERSYDGYVLLTEQMNDLVNPHGSPNVVVEGVLNLEGLVLEAALKRGAPPSRTGHVIAHAGTLDRLYGVGLLLDAFAAIADDDTELWLFGAGDMDEEIKQRAAEDRRIKHHGFRPRPEVFQRLQEADLLVNLRDPAEEYTKYSFPSKLLEYMVSGTPVATTSLSGIPPEYSQYLYVIESGGAQRVADELAGVLGRGRGELAAKGADAQKFMLTHKTAAAQCPHVEALLTTVSHGLRGDSS